MNTDIIFLEQYDELLVKQDMPGSDWWCIYLPNGESYDTKPVGFLQELKDRGNVVLTNLLTDEAWAA
jgi:hypothetical protein